MHPHRHRVVGTWLRQAELPRCLHQGVQLPGLDQQPDEQRRVRLQEAAVSSQFGHHVNNNARLKDVCLQLCAVTSETKDVNYCASVSVTFNLFVFKVF
jgi:hypothetical protein